MVPNVVAATDMSNRSTSVVEEAGRFAKMAGCEQLSLLHVVSEERLLAMEQERPEEFRFADIVLAQVLADLKSWATSILGGDGPRVDPHVLRGEPGTAILEWAARSEADYVVIGVRKRSRVGKLLLGSTSQVVLLGATASVLAVPTG